MIDTAPSDPTAICEEILHAEKRYNLDHEILRSESEVIDRMLIRRLELTDSYAELHAKLGPHRNALETFISVVLSTAAIWSPERVAEGREGRRRLASVNTLIAEKAAELALLLREREELHNESGFASNTYYHVCCVIEDGAQNNYLYHCWVRDRLRALRSQFGLKYWPRIHEFMDALAQDADNATLEATDPITAEAATGPRGSRADFFKALFAAIEANRTSEGGFLPESLKLSDETLASLANCALDLSEDALTDSGYVKRLRQRLRDGARRHSPVFRSQRTATAKR